MEISELDGMMDSNRDWRGNMSSFRTDRIIMNLKSSVDRSQSAAVVAYLRVRVLRVNEGVDVLDAAVHADDQQESLTIKKDRAGQGMHIKKNTSQQWIYTKIH